MTTTKRIALAAMFASISIILTRFVSIIIPLGGYPSLSIDLGSVPILLGGLLLGPAFGSVVGLVSDLVGFLVNNRGGVFHVGFTINAVLTGLIPGLLVRFLKVKNFKNLLIGILTLLLFISLFYFLQTRSSDPQLNKILASVTLIAITIGLIFIVYKIKDLSLLKILFIVVVIEVFVYVALTPIWLYQLYNLPIMISILSRVFRALILVPIKTMIIYQSQKILKI